MLPLLAVRMLLASLCVLLFFRQAHGTVTAEAVDKAIHLVQQELNLIYNRYEVRVSGICYSLTPFATVSLLHCFTAQYNVLHC
jgi:hypothetical protein